MTSPHPERDATPGHTAERWWSTHIHTGPQRRRTSSAIRRARSVDQVLACACVHSLGAALRAAGHHTHPAQLAVIAFTLAHIERSAPRSIATVFGSPRGPGTTPRLRRRRFDAVVRARNHDALLEPLMRALHAIAGAGVSPQWTGHELFHWNANMAARWCMRYYREPERNGDESSGDDDRADTDNTAGTQPSTEGD